MEPVVCSWSGGKESALALDEIRNGATLEVAELMTTVGAWHDRLSIHGVRLALIERQADAIGVPLDVVRIPKGCDGRAYTELMTDTFARYDDRGIERLILGDVFLDDEDDYRGEALDRTGVSTYCPLHDRETDALIEQFLDSEYEAVTVAVDGDLGREFVGRRLDESFVADLPAAADPAGEDGEYHTFVYDGPTFDEPVAFETGQITEREVGDGTITYCDLVPTEDGAPGV
ncbi:ATP-binding protein [Halosimplex marinum]|uniref:Dph6-related ATP pyrophosphatase n=1 Tax=Halosimplex marinum TaxID=3396620 RepID=UPI003F551CE5